MVAMATATLPASFGLSGTGTSPTGPANSGNLAVDQISEFTPAAGILLKHVLTPAATGVAAISGFSTPTCFHSGAIGAYIATMGTDVTPATTVTYVAEVFVPNNCTLTGVSYLTGSSVAGNVQISLADSTGAPIAAALTASTSITVTAGYQKIPFAVAYAAKGPARYFVLVQVNSTGAKFRAHAVGNFLAGSVTGGTFGTFTTVAAVTTFTADLGPICSTY